MGLFTTKVRNIQASLQNYPPAKYTTEGEGGQTNSNLYDAIFQYYNVQLFFIKNFEDGQIEHNFCKYANHSFSI